jgi:hypothetical protein
MRKIDFMNLFLVLSTVFYSCSESSETKIPVDKYLSTGVKNIDTLGRLNPEADLTVEKYPSSKDESVVYFGTLPCGKCEGIEMWITLHSNQTYSLKTNYLGLNDALEEEFTGKFSYNKRDRIATLEGLKNRYPQQYKIAGNKMMQLDFGGKPNQNPLADQYILLKK